jgi:class 3 adenylate cyclase
MAVEPSPKEPAATTAERRLVSVLFADVVGSTALADRMDPEDWSAVIRRLIDIMAASVTRYGGSVVRAMGDGIVAVFGAPSAHEDDPIRAIHAGLDMVGAVAAAGPSLEHQSGTALEIRVGINTGLAIVEATTSDSGTSDVLGDTVNVAARYAVRGAPRNRSRHCRNVGSKRGCVRGNRPRRDRGQG